VPCPGSPAGSSPKAAAPEGEAAQAEPPDQGRARRSRAARGDTGAAARELHLEAGRRWRRTGSIRQASRTVVEGRRRNLRPKDRSLLAEAADPNRRSARRVRRVAAAGVAEAAAHSPNHPVAPEAEHRIRRRAAEAWAPALALQSPAEAGALERAPHTTSRTCSWVGFGRRIGRKQSSEGSGSRALPRSRSEASGSEHSLPVGFQTSALPRVVGLHAIFRPFPGERSRFSGSATGISGPFRPERGRPCRPDPGGRTAGRDERRRGRPPRSARGGGSGA
jgi:hypothetical protein